jgi:hypothetical protein
VRISSQLSEISIADQVGASLVIRSGRCRTPTLRLRVGSIQGERGVGGGRTWYSESREPMIDGSLAAPECRSALPAFPKTCLSLSLSLSVSLFSKRNSNSSSGGGGGGVGGNLDSWSRGRGYYVRIPGPPLCTPTSWSRRFL